MRTGLGHGPLNRTGRTIAVLYAGWRHDCRPKHEDSESNRIIFHLAVKCRTFP